MLLSGIRFYELVKKLLTFEEIKNKNFGAKTDITFTKTVLAFTVSKSEKVFSNLPNFFRFIFSKAFFLVTKKEVGKFFQTLKGQKKEEE